MTSNVHDVRARDPERAELQRQFDEWRAAGNLPELVTTCRPEKMAPSQSERNAATWENRK